MGLAIRNATLTAAAGLLLGFDRRIFCIDFVEILIAKSRISFGGHVPIHRDKFQHRLLSHPFGHSLYSFVGGPISQTIPE
jgi:Zn-dependent protease